MKELGKDFVAVQQCRSLDGWIPVEVESNSEPGTYYVVMVNAWGTDYICSCPGFRFRRKCSHQRKALFSLCRWEENAASEVQTPAQYKNMICPRCGAATRFDIRYTGK